LLGLSALVCVLPLPAQRVVNETLNFPDELAVGDYALERAFGERRFNQPLTVTSPPGDARIFVVEKPGRIQIVQPGDVESEAEPFLDISDVVVDGGEQGLLGLAFHPEYAENGFFYVFYSHTQGGERRQRVARFTVSSGNPDLADRNSEQVLIDQLDQASNHNGGDMHFGPDGYLYIALGDEGGSNDGYQNGQLVDRDFFAGLLRIDVDRRSGSIEPTPHEAIPRDGANLAYFTIPPDNPLVPVWQDAGSDPESDLRLEFFAIGLRNPWRFSFDPTNGKIWCGDVGQNAREEIDLIVKGGNYGWANREGFISGPRNVPEPEGFDLRDPVMDYPRNEGTSVTGGVVYRRDRFASLQGHYIFADFGSGRIWKLNTEVDTPVKEEMLTQSGIASLGYDPANGDVLLSDLYSGIIWRLVETLESRQDLFPQLLSETGAFSDMASLTPAEGVHPYNINLRFWSDHADKRRWFALQVDAPMTYSQDDPWSFPTGTVWVKHFDLELERGNPASAVRVETRFLIKTAEGAYGLSYRWNAEQTDAVLVDHQGEDFDFTIREDGQERVQTWRIPGQAECMVCHTASAGFALSFNARQLNRWEGSGEERFNRLQRLSDAGYISGLDTEPHLLPAFSDPENEQVSLEHRVRSYLAVNCANCHRPGASANNTWDARPELSLEATRLINGAVNNPNGVPENRLVVPGDVEHSVLLHRVEASHGFSRMPPLASNELDEEGIALLRAWILEELPQKLSFEDWQALHYDDPQAEIAAAGEDADGDGDSNYLEFLNDTDPRNAGSQWNWKLVQDESGLRILFPSGLNRIYTLEVSDNLMDWEVWSVPQNLPQATALREENERLIAWDDLGEWPLFLRMRVEE